MNIRLMGTAAECAVAVEQLRGCLEVVEESPPRPNRGVSELVRVYLEVRVP